MALDFDWSAAIDSQPLQSPEGFGAAPPMMASPYLGGMHMAAGSPYLGQMENAANQYQSMLGGMGGMGSIGGLQMAGSPPYMSGMGGTGGMQMAAEPRRSRPSLFGGLGRSMRQANRFRNRRMGGWEMDPRENFLRDLRPVRRWARQFGRGQDPWNRGGGGGGQSEVPVAPPVPERPSWQDRRRWDRGQNPSSWYPDDLQMALGPYGGGYWASMM